jgi:hypothetical protein
MLGNMEQLKPHLQSATITFATALGLELYAATADAVVWSDVGWTPLLSAATLTATRAVVRALLDLRGAR